ncbi:hypothetical protein ACOMHN_014041 [Nucella lapillus]
MAQITSRSVDCRHTDTQYVPQASPLEMAQITSRSVDCRHTDTLSMCPRHLHCRWHRSRHGPWTADTPTHSVCAPGISTGDGTDHVTVRGLQTHRHTQYVTQASPLEIAQITSRSVDCRHTDTLSVCPRHLHWRWHRSRHGPWTADIPTLSMCPRHLHWRWHRSRSVDCRHTDTQYVPQASPLEMAQITSRRQTWQRVGKGECNDAQCGTDGIHGSEWGKGGCNDAQCGTDGDQTGRGRGMVFAQSRPLTQRAVRRRHNFVRFVFEVTDAKTRNFVRGPDE